MPDSVLPCSHFCVKPVFCGSGSNPSGRTGFSRSTGVFHHLYPLDTNGYANVQLTTAIPTQDGFENGQVLGLGVLLLASAAHPFWRIKIRVGIFIFIVI